MFYSHTTVVAALPVVWQRHITALVQNNYYSNGDNSATSIKVVVSATAVVHSEHLQVFKSDESTIVMI
jgi:hypothetical protein